MKALSTLRRVVVTGLGVCCPLGVGVEYVWRRLLEGHSGITSLPRAAGSRFEGLPSQVVGVVPRGSGRGQFTEEDWVSVYQRRTMSLPSILALCAATQALEHAKWTPKSEEEQARTGVAIGSCIPDFEDIVNTDSLLKGKQYRRLSPHFVTRVLTNLPAGQVSMRFGLLGPNHAVATACTTGAHAVGDAAGMIARGACDVMVAGGTESCIHPIAFAGFCRAKALSVRFNSEPERASRPFDSQRDGFVMSEGAAVVVLEELEHARGRGAPIHAEILGYGMSSDAHHVTAPRSDGKGAQLSMTMAIKEAGLTPESIGHINAHATSTPIGDIAENRAIKEVFGKHAGQLLISAPKGSTGHLLGASGAIETIFTILAVKEGVAPPTINLDSTGPELDLNYVPRSPVQWTSNGARRVALTNSFGFGGTNASLCIGEL